MAVEQESAQGEDRRARSREKLHTLVETRTETLALYADLAAHQPFTADPDVIDSIQNFCQALVDYAATAHFQLYRYIADNKERRQAVVEIAEEVYPQIARTTDAILDFNDRYDVAHFGERVGGLADDLSSLGEMLADRIQWEDRVIAAFGGFSR